MTPSGDTVCEPYNLRSASIGPEKKPNNKPPSMLASDDLIDQYALVRPDLTHDPVQKQNQAGLIISADIGRDDFIVLFPDNKHGLYSSDSLLILKPIEEIHHFLAEQGEHLAFQDLKTLMQMDLF